MTFTTFSTNGCRCRRFVVCTLIALAACSPSKLVEVQPPSGLVDPAQVATSSGATQLYNYAIGNFSFVYGGNVNGCSGIYTLITGAITDELMFNGRAEFDTRQMTTGALSGNNSCGSYFWQNVFNQPRVEARQAREALARYVPASTALQGRLASTEAFNVLMLADLYCSGIPMSTVTFTGEAHPSAGLSTDSLYAYAGALFDTALIESADSVRFVYLAQIGKARALLSRGMVSQAAQEVQGVPTAFVYLLTYTSDKNGNLFGSNPRVAFTQDREGTNGIVWSADPRAAITTTPTLSSAMPITGKYSVTAAGTMDPAQTILTNPIWLASGVEARLIEAEADLAAGGSNWLAILNTLRATCIGTSPCAPVPGLTAAALPPVADPGTAATRLDLLMKERALWLFLTGHRQGDLRRMARVYHRDKETLWPTGIYIYPGFPPLIVGSTNNGTSYGVDVVLSPEGSSSEIASNPLYNGCFNLDP